MNHYQSIVVGNGLSKVFTAIWPSLHSVAIIDQENGRSHHPQRRVGSHYDQGRSKASRDPVWHPVPCKPQPLPDARS